MRSEPRRVTVAGLLLLVSTVPVPSAEASGFIDDSGLSAGLYYWQRQRDRKIISGEEGHAKGYQQNLHHATFNGSLDYSSGYFKDVIGLDLAIFGALETFNSGPAAPNEIGFSDARTRWDERWTGDHNDISLYKAALKLKSDPFWLRAGYLQPSGQSLLAPHWSFLPGTYQGAEAGYQPGENGKLSFSYMWARRYKAPWYPRTYNFRKADGVTGIPYLHSIGFKYAASKQLTLEGAYGQAAGYMDQYFSKVSWTQPLFGNDLSSAWHFYGAHDREKGGAGNVNDVYDGLAWLQAITLGYSIGPVDLRLEGSWVRARGNQGFFLQRLTPGYATSNGRIDVWWDSRSDWNANGEKALFAGVAWELSGWNLPGWGMGTSAAVGWGARPSTNPVYDQRQRLKESAWNLDLFYTLQNGRAKGTLFKLHFTRYNNHSRLPSYGGGYGNLFQDEKDVKFMVIAPFTLF